MKKIWLKMLCFVLSAVTLFSVFGVGVSAKGTDETVTINIKVEGAGKASSSVKAKKGDSVSLSVKADDLAEFIGWYENGELVCEKEKYTFTAKEDRSLLAKFTTMQSVENIYIFTTYKRRTFDLNEHLNLPEKGKYTVVYQSSDESVATVDEKGNVRTTGRGEAVITYTVTLENGKEITQSIGIDVVYTLRQWLIIIFLFGWLWY